MWTEAEAGAKRRTTSVTTTTKEATNPSDPAFVLFKSLILHYKPNCGFDRKNTTPVHELWRFVLFILLTETEFVLSLFYFSFRFGSQKGKKMWKKNIYENEWRIGIEFICRDDAYDEVESDARGRLLNLELAF